MQLERPPESTASCAIILTFGSLAGEPNASLLFANL